MTLAISLFVAAATLAAALSLVRLLRGPTLQDRLLGWSAAVTALTLALAAAAVAAGRPRWIDAALALALVSLLGAAAAYKAIRLRSFQPPLAAERAEGGP